jgi:hypothetical protein
MTYREIEDIKRINSLVKGLNRKITARASMRGLRRIGYPGGHENRSVLFLEHNGDDSLWYASWQDHNRDQHVTLLGRGNWQGNEWLSIDVQFNFPITRYNRRKGAAFLEDIETGQEFLAHRGLVTLGSRVPKDVVLEAMATDVVEVQTSVGLEEFLLVCPLDSEYLVHDVGRFARQLRDTVRNLGKIRTSASRDTDNGDKDQNDEHATGTSTLPSKLSDPLKAYFDEFSGQRRSFVPQVSTALCIHGDVVRALYEAIAPQAKTWKSRAVDLVAELSDIALLFEVKTAADTQNVYCAVGQLAVHEPAVHEYLNKPVRKILIVPSMPQEMLARTLVGNLHVSIATYSISRIKEISFVGLEKLGLNCGDDI